MSENNSRKNEQRLNKEYKTLLKDTFYNYLNLYSTYIFSLGTSFIIARTISMEQWGFMILALSYIAIVTNVLSFFPPALSFTLAYYISRYRIQNENNKLKSIIKYGIYQRIVPSTLFFIGSFIVFLVLMNSFKINLKEHVNLLFILSPLILKSGLDGALLGFNQGFNMFKTRFYLLVLKNTIYIGALIYIFFFVNSISVELITLIYFISELIPFFVNFLILAIIYMKIPHYSEEPKLSFKESLRMIKDYGIYVSIGVVIGNLWNQVELISIGTFQSTEWVTGYNISSHYNSVARIGLSSTTNPLLISFSRLDSIKNYNQIRKIFNLVLHYTAFLFMLAAGVLIIASDFFLSFFYGDSYLKFSFIIKLMLISSIFTILMPQFNALMQATNKVKLIPKIRLIFLIIKIPSFFIGLLYFGIVGALFGVTIYNIIILIITIILSDKVYEIKIEVERLISQYLIFAFSLTIISILEIFFLGELNYMILGGLNLLFIFNHFNILSIISFLILFLSLNIIFRVFHREDIENLIMLFEGKKKVNNLIVKILKIFKKFLR